MSIMVTMVATGTRELLEEKRFVRKSAVLITLLPVLLSVIGSSQAIFRIMSML